MNAAEKVRLHSILKAEFAKHKWDTFVDEPPSMTQGGRGVVCPDARFARCGCKTLSQFTGHLAEKVCEAVDRELFLTKWAYLPLDLTQIFAGTCVLRLPHNIVSALGHRKTRRAAINGLGVL